MTQPAAEGSQPTPQNTPSGGAQTDGPVASEEPKRNDPARAVRPRGKTPHKETAPDGGKLKIGDDWNAIRIIALSQSNPLKAIAEFVENSIDAHAKTITITRGREHGAHYLADQGRRRRRAAR